MSGLLVPGGGAPALPLQPPSDPRAVLDRSRPVDLCLHGAEPSPWIAPVTDPYPLGRHRR